MSITTNQSNILNQTIGIAGCGEMGYPMLKVLLQNDINATGHDVKASENFKDFGNKFIPSKSEFFLKNDVILSIVRDTIETENLLNNTLLRILSRKIISQQEKVSSNLKAQLTRGILN